MAAVIADFRSDTVTRPSAGMRQAMLTAELGDDVYGDDPTVNRLEAYIAELTGKEAALLCTSGTQSNLVALLAHCQRGDEYIVGQEAHTYKYEGGGAAVLGSIQPQPIEFEADRTLDLDKVRAKLKADNPHFARSRLLCLENTCGGVVLPLDYHARAAEFCATQGLALHLDGARLFNATQQQGVSARDITRALRLSVTVHVQGARRTGGITIGRRSGAYRGGKQVAQNVGRGYASGWYPGCGLPVCPGT